MATRITDLRGGGEDAYSALDDRLLVLDFQSGHPEAFVEIHHRYSGLSRHICQRILGNTYDADEAVQETWIRVFQGLHRFNGRYALQPWVARIATNVALDATRARTRRPTMGDRPIHELHDEVADHVDREPPETVERMLESDLVHEVLSRLPAHHRRALMLREFEGRSHEEIGQALGITPPQAKALLHRARESFKRLWLALGERAGAAAILPLIPAVKLVHFLRRFADRAGDTGQQVVNSPAVQNVVALPAVSASVSQTGERVVAAAMTLIVAGGVTVGAATLTRHPEPVRERAAQVVVAPTPVAAPTIVPTPAPSPADQTRARDPHSEPRGVPPVVVGDPEPSGSPTPGPSPTDQPSDPSPTPPATAPPSQSPPVVPPAPGWTGGFAVDWTSNDDCGCGPGVSLIQDSSSGRLTADSQLEAVQSFTGAAADAEGDPAWALDGEYRAQLGVDSGSLSLVFTLHIADADVQYVMTTSSVTIDGAPGTGDPVTYTFTGSYGASGAAQNASPIPTGGSASVRIVVWGDGTTVVAADVSAGV